MPDVFETPYEYSRRLHGLPPRGSFSSYRRAMTRLEKQGWVRKSEKEGKIFFRLTKKGRVRALLHKLQEGKLKRNSKERYLAVFDIPERCRRERDALRTVFHILKFVQVQKSVYLCGSISKDIRWFLRLSGLYKYIRFFRIK